MDVLIVDILPPILSGLDMISAEKISKFMQNVWFCLDIANLNLIVVHFSWEWRIVC